MNSKEDRYKAKERMTNPKEDENKPFNQEEMFSLRKELLEALQPGENATNALSRLHSVFPKVFPHRRHGPNRRTVKTENSASHKLARANGEKENEVQKADNGTKAQREQAEMQRYFERIASICIILAENGYKEVFSDTKEVLQKKFMKEEEELNPDHNVVDSNFGSRP